MRAISLTCFVGTSSKDKTLAWSVPRQKISAREFGAHEGSSPETSVIAGPPRASTMQIENPDAWEVKAIHLPSGDQSGSVGFGAPSLFKRRISPPDAEIV